MEQFVPQDDEIDLTLLDVPHGTSGLEWWHLNCHLQLENNKNISIFATFQRILYRKDVEPNKSQYAYFLSWALTDVTAKKYYQLSRVDQATSEISLAQLQEVADPNFRKALAEIFQQGNVLLPDCMFTTEVKVAKDTLELNFENCTLRKSKQGYYELKLMNVDEDIECHLLFSPQKKALCKGENGEILGAHGEEMFSYFIPFNAVQGKVRIGKNKNEVIAQGQGWYERAYSVVHQTKSTLDLPTKLGEQWVSIQLSNGCEISAAYVNDPNSRDKKSKWLIASDVTGGVSSTHHFEFTENLGRHNHWKSKCTFTTYPISWCLKAPGINLELEINAQLDAQEFETFTFFAPGFWEGSCVVSGLYHGEKVTGLAYLRRTGFDKLIKIEDFFTAVSDEVLLHTHKLLPLKITANELQQLAEIKGCSEEIMGVDLTIIEQSIIRPIREIIDRQGKAWRSYFLLACCSAVGGDFKPYLPLLALPELLHVGSLIIDDIEDQSELRRGGPTCHKIYGTPTAINAGSIAYFIPQLLYEHYRYLPYETQCHLYELYFQAVRTAHIGQALDIADCEKLIHDILMGTEAPAKLESRVLAIHRMKAGLVAEGLARMGAILGKGSEEQINKIGEYAEAVGVAFQIIDDVINIELLEKGKKKLKVHGEDISQGKITYPVARAHALLPLDEYCALLSRIHAKPNNVQEIHEIILILQNCGAIEASRAQAEKMINKSWNDLSPLLLNGHAKLMLRVFGLYVIERHYYY
ncbi:MAG: polyprenyl synthetase family protein [Gammaproteobacteria bacterium]|nr:polyprenyl synthetase family protein [Gammaproteobacteria bacterium]